MSLHESVISDIISRKRLNHKVEVMPILRCHIVVNEFGVKQFFPFALEDDVKATLISDNVTAFNVFPNGDRIDMRSKPPFHSIIPCPHCGTDNDRKHDLSKHTDSKLGIPEAMVTDLAKQLAAEKQVPDQWQKFTVEAANKLLSKRT